MNRALILVVIVAALGGCGSFEKWKRPDGSSVAVLRSIDDTWPLFAKEVKVELEGAGEKKEEVKIASAKFGVSDEVKQLYEQMDQINASVRSLVVSEYTMYINTELDPDVEARKEGREKWRQIHSELSKAALDLRKANQQIEKLPMAASPEEAKSLIKSAQRDAENARQDVRTDKESGPASMIELIVKPGESVVLGVTKINTLK